MDGKNLKYGLWLINDLIAYKPWSVFQVLVEGGL
jgi:hypothetical protein